MCNFNGADDSPKGTAKQAFHASSVTRVQELVSGSAFEPVIRLRRMYDTYELRSGFFENVFASKDVATELRRRVSGEVEPTTGFEPVTLGLRYLCSTN